MKVTILQFPGTNCEYDTEHAFKSLGAKTEILWHKSEAVPEDTDLLVVAGKPPEPLLQLFRKDHDPVPGADQEQVITSGKYGVDVLKAAVGGQQIG